MNQAERVKQNVERLREATEQGANAELECLADLLGRAKDRARYVPGFAPSQSERHARSYLHERLGDLRQALDHGADFDWVLEKLASIVQTARLTAKRENNHDQ